MTTIIECRLGLNTIVSQAKPREEGGDGGREGMDVGREGERETFICEGFHCEVFVGRSILLW